MIESPVKGSYHMLINGGEVIADDILRRHAWGQGQASVGLQAQFEPFHLDMSAEG